jgi:hypothetical protein
VLSTKASQPRGSLSQRGNRRLALCTLPGKPGDAYYDASYDWVRAQSARLPRAYPELSHRRRVTHDSAGQAHVGRSQQPHMPACEQVH